MRAGAWTLRRPPARRAAARATPSRRRAAARAPPTLRRAAAPPTLENQHSSEIQGIALIHKISSKTLLKIPYRFSVYT